jgi:hypothetical protein
MADRPGTGSATRGYRLVGQNRPPKRRDGCYMLEMNVTAESKKTRALEEIPTGMRQRTPSSRVLAQVIGQAPADYFTVGWLTSTLQRRSFGFIMLFLGLLATIPVGSTLPGLMLAAMAVQLVGGRSEPVFPEFIRARRFRTSHLRRLGGRTVQLLTYFEKIVHPRGPMIFEAMKPVVGVVVLLLTAVLLLTPVPLSNVAPAVVIALMSLAYVEDDGLLLCISLIAAIILIVIASAAIWGAVAGVVLISQFR